MIEIYMRLPSSMLSYLAVDDVRTCHVLQICAGLAGVDCVLKFIPSEHHLGGAEGV